MKEINMGIHNKFEIIKRDAITGEVLGEWKAENIILNQGWSVILSAACRNFADYIHFGSGTATPLVTNTALTSFLGSKSATKVSVDISTISVDDTMKVKKTCRLQDAEFIGSTISEVGFADGSASNTLRTKALIKDMNGNPVSIPKGAGEIIDIFATYYIKMPRNFGTDATMDRKLTGITLLAALSGNEMWNETKQFNYSKYRPYRDGQSQAEHQATCTVTWDVPNKKIIYSAANLISSAANIGGLGSVSVHGIAFKLPTTGLTQPVLAKEVVGTGDGSTKDFKVLFGHILNNGTAKAFVNDIEVPATFEYQLPPPTTDIKGHLRWLGDTYISSSRFNGKVQIFEHPFYASYGITMIRLNNSRIFTSDDGITWTQAASCNAGSLADISIPSEHQSKRYWKVVGLSNETTEVAIDTINSATLAASKPVHLETAPASGATVAVTYQPDIIAKDANHIINNVVLTVVLNEYTPT